MALYDLQTIYARLERNAMVTPQEVLILVRDINNRLKKLEATGGSETRLEEPKPDRRRSSKVSSKKVSSD